MHNPGAGMGQYDYPDACHYHYYAIQYHHAITRVISKLPVIHLSNAYITSNANATDTSRYRVVRCLRLKLSSYIVQYLLQSYPPKFTTSMSCIRPGEVMFHLKNREHSWKRGFPPSQRNEWRHEPLRYSVNIYWLDCKRREPLDTGIRRSLTRKLIALWRIRCGVVTACGREKRN